ncbi:MAG: extracellular solute-binding protein [Candidatus Hydrogenedentes bacterium]|nr:extracellular solute-binding protein [Candidatus Hydrogenedentota bacterium]
MALFVACGHVSANAADVTIRVMCGSSMSAPVKQLAEAFERETGVKVELTMGGCETLLPQAEIGAPGDVFVGHAPFADMLKEKGLREDAVAVVGSLYPTVVVPKGNPKHIASLKDLARADVKAGLPDARYSTCGQMFEDAAKAANLLDAIHPAYTSRAHAELATALQTGNVDVVVVWTFVAAQHKDAFEIVPVDAKFPSADVFVTVLKHAQQPDAARRFVAFLQTGSARKIFEEMGYGAVAKSGTLAIYCAAGVQKPMEELVALFMARNAGVHCETQYQGSGALLAQMGIAKTGDIYVAGDDSFMAQAKAKGFVTESKPLAVFTPVIAVPKGNPRGIHALADLASSGVRLGLGEEKTTAVGHTAREWFKRMGVLDGAFKNLVSTTVTVEALAIQAASGALDACVIWDATAFQFKDRPDVVVRGDDAARVDVPIGALTFSRQADLANAFIALATSPEAADILRKHGFAPPTP